MLIEKLMPDDYVKYLINIVDNFEFAWYWNNTAVYSKKNYVNNFQFTHGVYIDDRKNSSYFENVLSILDRFEELTNFKIKKIERIKFNLQTKLDLSEEDKKDLFHRDVGPYGVEDACYPFDMYKNYYSLVYYVIDSDGDTVILDDDKNIKETISPIAGNAVYFPSTQLHAGYFPIQNKRRIVVNFVFEVE